MSDKMTEAHVSSFPHVTGYELYAEERRDRLGVVYRARQLLYRREVSLRLIDDRVLGGGRDLTALCRAARDASGVTHPNLEPLYEVGDSEGQMYLASDEPSGPALRQRLAGKGMEPTEAVRVLLGVTRAIQHLHEHHLLHLGLTSECVFLEGGASYVGDLGLAEFLHSHPDSPCPADPSYAAPEQLARKKADARADVYSLGSLLYECLTGQAPYAAATPEEAARLAAAGRWRRPHQVNPACPAELDRICGKARAARPGARYASAADLAADLERFQHGEAPAARGLPRLTGWMSRHTGAAALIGAVVGAVVCGVVFGAIHVAWAAAARDRANNSHRQGEQLVLAAQQSRDEQKRLADSAADKVLAAEQQARRALLDRDQERQRLRDEERLRKQADKLAAEQARFRAAAEDRARTAEEARKMAVAARAVAARQVDRLYVGQGTALLETGDLSGALVPFARALAAAHREKLPEESHRLRIAGLLARCPRPLCLLAYKKGDLNTVHLSPDGKRLLTVGADGVLVVRNASVGKLMGKRMVNGAAVVLAAFSPDGKRVLSGDAAGRLRLWNVEDASDVFDPAQLDAVPIHLGFSSDGKRFVAVTAMQADEPEVSVQVHDAASGEAIGEAFTKQVAPRSASLSPDGKQILLCCTDRCARLRDVKTGKQVGPSLAHAGNVVAATFSGDGRRILTVAADGTASVWDALTGKPIVASVEHGHATVPAQLDESGALVLTAGKDDAVRVYDASTGKRVGPTLRTRTALRQAMLSPDGRHAVVAGDDGVVRIHDVITGEPALPPLMHGRPLSHLAVAPDGGRVLTFDGRTLRVWDLTAGEPLAPAGPSAAEGGVYNADATRQARIQGDTVQIHEAATGKAVGAAMKHKGEVRTVVFSPQGDRVLTVSNPPEGATGTPTWDVRVWDAATGEAVSEVMEHLREVHLASFVGDGASVLTAALDKKVRLWDAKTGKPTGKAMEHPEDVVLAVVSPDGAHVATSDKEGMTRVWDPATGNRVGEGMAHAAAVRFIGFSGDGKSLATACEDGTARVWEASTGRRLMEAAHGGAVTHTAFSPEARVLLTGSADGTARAWDVRSGKAHTPPLAHRQAVQFVRFSEDGRWLLTAAGRFVRVWDAVSGEPIGPPLEHSRRPGLVTSVTLSKTGMLRTEAGPGTRWTRMLVGDKRSDTDLEELARVLSGREEAGPGLLTPVAPGDLESAWDHLTARNASEFDATRGQLLAWAMRGADECEARGLWGGAVRHLGVLLEESASPARYARRGKARLQIRLYEGALADFDKALAKGTGPAEWCAGRGAAAAALGRWEQAEADLVKATGQDERRPEWWRQLGQVQGERGQWKKSADSLVKAIRFGAGDPAAWYEQALAQLSAGDGKGYRRTCGRLVKKFGDKEEAAVRRVVADACVLGPEALADFTGLLERAEKAVLAAPGAAEEERRLAALLLRAGQAGRAAALLEKSAGGENALPAEMWLLAVAHQKAGQAEKAREWLGKAMKRKPVAGAPWQERQTSALWQQEADATVKGSGK